MGREGRFMLATQQVRRLGGQMAEGLPIGIDDKPLWSRYWNGRGFHLVFLAEVFLGLRDLEDSEEAEETEDFCLESSVSFESFVSSESFRLRDSMSVSTSTRSTTMAQSPWRVPAGTMRVRPDWRFT